MLCTEVHRCICDRHHSAHPTVDELCLVTMDSYKSSPVFSGMFPAAVVAGASTTTASAVAGPAIMARHASPFARVATLVATSPSGDNKPWNARFSHPIPHDNSYYFKCMIAGVLSCGVTHTMICPLDVVKCNMQTNPTKYKYRGLIYLAGSASAEFFADIAL